MVNYMDEKYYEAIDTSSEFFDAELQPTWRINIEHSTSFQREHTGENGSHSNDQTISERPDSVQLNENKPKLISNTEALVETKNKTKEKNVELLDEIMNMEKMNHKEQCIPISFLYSHEVIDKISFNKINLQVNSEGALREPEHLFEENRAMKSIKAVKELEAGNEYKFKRPRKHRIDVNEIVLTKHRRLATVKDRNAKARMKGNSSVLSADTNGEIPKTTLHVSCYPRMNYTIGFMKNEGEQINLNSEIHSNISSTPRFDMKNKPERKYTADSDEIFSPMSTKSIRVFSDSSETFPELMWRKIAKKTYIVKNVHKADTLPAETNVAKSDSAKKKSTTKTAQELDKTRSLIVDKETRGGPKKISKNFPLHSTDLQNGSNKHPPANIAIKVIEKKIDRKSEKIIKSDKETVRRTKKINKAINTTKTQTRNVSCQKVGAFIDSSSFCSVSLTLKSTHNNVTKNELIKSLKDYYWRSELQGEKVLIQFLILCMDNNFQEISIVNEKFRLYCQNEFSSGSSAEVVDRRHLPDDSALICQSLLSDTVTQNEVNRFVFQLKDAMVHEQNFKIK